MEPTDQLSRIEARLERIENALNNVGRELPNAVAVATDSLDEWVARHPDFNDRLEAALPVLERLTRPETLRAATTLMDHLDAVPGVMAMALDAADDVARQATEHGIPMGTLVEELGANVAAFVKVSRALRSVMESPIVEAKAIETVGRLAETMANVTDQPAPVGLWGAMRAMKDPEVQRSVGFAVEIARGFGRQNGETK